MGRMAAFKDKPTPKAEEPAPKVEAYKPQTIRERYELDGEEEILTAEIDHISRTIAIENAAQRITLTYHQARELVQFLAWASREKCAPKEDCAVE